MCIYNFLPGDRFRVVNIIAKSTTQQRIYNGVKQGTIDRRELRHLERREAALNAARNRKLRDGHLTPQQRRQLNRRENRISRDIYRARH